MALGLVAAVFGLIFVAELPGKSTMAVLVLAASSSPLAVFFGACAAYLLHTALAVAAGGFIGLLPHKAVELAAGLLFSALAVWLWRERLSPPEALAGGRSFARSMATAFGVVFAAQWGDPTQLATAALAARHRDHPVAVFAGAAGGLIAVTALAVALGRLSKSRLRRGLLQKAAAVAFAAAGLAVCAHAFFS